MARPAMSAPAAHVAMHASPVTGAHVSSVGHAYAGYPRFVRTRQAHLLSANGVGIELFQFLDPTVAAPDDNFRYWQTGIFHLCITDPDLDGLVARVVAGGGRQRTKIWTFLPGRPYQLVYCEDPFGNIIEAFSHSYAETFSNIPGWESVGASTPTG